MAINWNDPSKNDPKDVEAVRQFIADTDPTVNQSHLYRPATQPAGSLAAAAATTRTTGARTT